MIVQPTYSLQNQPEILTLEKEKQQYNAAKTQKSRVFKGKSTKSSETVFHN